MGAALASIINGGTYYQPRLIDTYVKHDGTEQLVEPKVTRQNVVKRSVSVSLRELMEYAYSKNHVVYGAKTVPEGYAIGAKTGTAQVPTPDGGYYEDRFNGTFLGYIGGDMPQYVIVVRVNEPKIGGYAGSRAAGPIFTGLVESLINSGNVTSKIN